LPLPANVACVTDVCTGTMDLGLMDATMDDLGVGTSMASPGICTCICALVFADSPDGIVMPLGVTGWSVAVARMAGATGLPGLVVVAPENVGRFRPPFTATATGRLISISLIFCWRSIAAASIAAFSLTFTRALSVTLLKTPW